MTETFADAVVAIKSCEPDNEAFGTGFIIDRNETCVYVLTCAHVFEDTKRKNEDTESDYQVLVNGCQAKLAFSGQSRGIDLAVLSVEDESLKDKTPIVLSNSGQQERAFETIGYYAFETGGKIARRQLSGKLIKPFQVSTDNHQDLIDAWDLLVQDRDALEPGYSGAPVVDAATGHAVGVVSHRLKAGQEGHAIAISGLAQVWPERAGLIGQKVPAENKGTDEPRQAESKRPSARSRLNEKKIQNLEKQLSALEENWEALSNQRDFTNDAAQRNNLERQIASIEAEMDKVAQKLDALRD